MTHIKTCSSPEHDHKNCSHAGPEQDPTKNCLKTQRTPSQERLLYFNKEKLQNSVPFCSKAVSTGSCPPRTLHGAVLFFPRVMLRTPHGAVLFFTGSYAQDPTWSSFTFSRGHMLRPQLEQFFCRRSRSGPPCL